MCRPRPPCFPALRCYRLDHVAKAMPSYSIAANPERRLSSCRNGITIDVYAPDPQDLREMVRQHGINLFYKSVELRELCCEVRKVHPWFAPLTACQTGSPALGA